MYASTYSVQSSLRLDRLIQGQKACAPCSRATQVLSGVCTYIPRSLCCTFSSLYSPPVSSTHLVHAFRTLVSGDDATKISLDAIIIAYNGATRAVPATRRYVLYLDLVRIFKASQRERTAGTFAATRSEFRSIDRSPPRSRHSCSTLFVRRRRQESESAFLQVLCFYLRVFSENEGVDALL